MLWGIKGAERDVWGEFRECEWADTEHREGFIRLKQERIWKWRVSKESLFTKRWCKSLPDNGSSSLWENFREAEETWACQFLETGAKGEGGQEDLLSIWEQLIIVKITHPTEMWFPDFFLQISGGVYEVFQSSQNVWGQKGALEII